MVDPKFVVLPIWVEVSTSRGPSTCAVFRCWSLIGASFRCRRIAKNLTVSKIETRLLVAKAAMISAINALSLPEVDDELVVEVVSVGDGCGGWLILVESVLIPFDVFVVVSSELVG